MKTMMIAPIVLTGLRTSAGCRPGSRPRQTALHNHAHCVPELLSIQLSIDSDIIRHREG
jgi:hypothetical protein